MKNSRFPGLPPSLVWGQARKKVNDILFIILIALASAG
jgi:hypothetical protein